MLLHRVGRSVRRIEGQPICSHSDRLNFTTGVCGHCGHVVLHQEGAYTGDSVARYAPRASEGRVTVWVIVLKRAGNSYGQT